MSSRHYEELWREGVAELVAHLDAEHPEDRAAAPKKLEDWARLYLRYVGTYHKLCAAHGGLAQPQKRRAARRSLETCLGRLLELRNWLAAVQGGVEVLGVLSEQLVGAGLTPEALELPVPAYFREVRADQLEARARAAAAAAEAEAAGGGGSEAAAVVDGGEAAAAQGDAAAAEEADGSEPDSNAEKEEERQVADSSPPQPGGDAPAAASQEQQEQETSRALEDEASRVAAAVALQAAARGWLSRRRVAAERREEMEFLGMLPPAAGGRSEALQGKLAAIAAERKQRQVARQAELDGGLLAIKAGVRQREGWAVKEQIRDKLHTWFLASRDPETGEYADLPESDKGGSRDIMRPLPPAPSAEEAAAAAARAGKAGASAAGKPGAAAGGKGGKGGAAAGAAPVMRNAFLQGLLEAVQEYVDVWQEYEPTDPTLALLPPELQGLPQPRGGSGWEAYDADMATAEVRPVVHEELRLEADEEMRVLIRSIKDPLKAEWEGKKKKKGDKKGAGGKGGGAKKTATSGANKKGEGGKGGKKGAGDAAEGAAPPKKKRKDLTAGRSIESIFAELAGAGLVRQPSTTCAEDFLGGDRLARPLAFAMEAAAVAAAAAAKPKVGGKKANAAAAPAAASKPAAGSKGKAGGAAAGAGEEVAQAYPEPSLAQARQAVVASCILPLGAHAALAKLQAPHTVLLYGPPGTGKSLLAAAVAHQAGATLFDLSPAATAGKYAGKAAATMVHMVFKAARAMAPSLILLEDADQVFVSDKTRAKLLAATLPGGEPPNRIKKQLLAEAADLEPGDGVLVLCTSSQPQACVKKDERVLRSFVQRYIQLPLPDHGGRLALLQAFAQRESLDLQESLSLLAQLTEGLSAGQLQAFVQQLALRMLEVPAAPASTAAASAADAAGQAEGSLGSRSSVGKEKRQKPLALVEAALEVLPGFAPQKEDAAAMREWTAQVHQPLPAEEEGAAKQVAKKGGAGKKK